MSVLRWEGTGRPARIYLTGFMASGKTTIGRRLARRLDWTFVDLDEAVTMDTGRSIAELFADGEEAFRREEHRVLKKVSSGARRVIALGGGALHWGNALDFVKARGLLVYLRVDIDTLLRRLELGEGVRPLVAGYAGLELRRQVGQLLAGRRPYYESAAVIVDCDESRSEESIVAELSHVLERRLSADRG